MNQRSITRRGCLDWLGYLPYTQVVMGSNPIPSMLFMGLYILFIKKFKVVYIANDVILGLEKRLNSCKRAPSYYG